MSPFVLRPSSLVPVATIVAAMLAVPLSARIGAGDSPAGLLETIPPFIGSISAPASASALPVAINFSGVTDADNALLSVELWSRPASGVWQPTGLTQPVGVGTFPFAPIVGGVHHLDLVAIDAVGNTSVPPSGASTGLATITIQPAASVADWWMLP